MLYILVKLHNIPTAVRKELKMPLFLLGINIIPVDLVNRKKKKVSELNKNKSAHICKFMIIAITNL